ncbi:hemin-degrading factor [Comamonas testosteroni]|uniref:Hemin-degrading factor n=1 Tax=Comamonas testosteroni TaxID=285 RepID=A0A373FNQ3_COMTE|nr:ChuX/HutX family heme-like substrate-binding protein [Comamonas testosteroni]RGE45142.1 hemin-degrading factor [Comamonas testosteroni]
MNALSTTENTVMDAVHIREQFAAQRALGLRAKDAAEALQLSEGAVIAAHGGEHERPLKAVALRAEWLEILKGLEDCGTVMALTRNESTVHEKDGIYQNLSAQGPIGLALSREIDLRLFFMHWHAGFAVTEESANGNRPSMHSLQFYDAAGRAVHKVFAREATDMSAWNALVARFAEPAAGFVFRAPAAKPAIKPDSEIDVPALAQSWADMKDTHEFFEMLRKHGAERQQAFRLVPQFCQPLLADAVTQLLGNAAVDGVSIMVFVGSSGCIQIHTGPVSNIQPMDGKDGVRWINVLDKGFNLHLRTDMIDKVWLVQKPTSDGIVTSVEVFDHEGNNMAMFFGERKPGQPELQSWRELAASLPRLNATAEVA